MRKNATVLTQFFQKNFRIFHKRKEKSGQGSAVYQNSEMIAAQAFAGKQKRTVTETVLFQSINKYRKLTQRLLPSWLWFFWEPLQRLRERVLP